MVCCLQETHFSFKDVHRLSVKRWIKIFQANGNQKKANGSYTCIRQNRLEGKNGLKRQKPHCIMIYYD